MNQYTNIDYDIGFKKLQSVLYFIKKSIPYKKISAINI